MNQSILKDLGVQDALLLGEGVEAWIYELNEQQVIRIYKKNSSDLVQRLEVLQTFYNSLQQRPELATPFIVSINESRGTVYTIDRKLSGSALAGALKAQPIKTRHALLTTYISIAEQIASLQPSYHYFGEILATQPLRTETWPEFIIQKTVAAYASSRILLDAEIEDMPVILNYIETNATMVSDVTKPLLVHGDYHPFNVLIDKDHKNWALADFGGLTLAGDPRMDLASGIVSFFEEEDGMVRADGEFIYSQIVKKHGENIKQIIHLYRLYYSVCFAAFCRDRDSRAYEWAIRSLREHLKGSYDY